MVIWPLFFIVAAGIVLAAVIVAGPRLFSGTRLSTRVIRCPVRNRDFCVEFVELVWDGKLVDVKQCSAFTPPAAVDCDRACVEAQQSGPTSHVRAGFA